MPMLMPCSLFPCQFYGDPACFNTRSCTCSCGNCISIGQRKEPSGSSQSRIMLTKESLEFASLKMGLTGSILLAFIVFHLLHFTVRTIYPEYNEMMTVVGSPDSNEIHDVFYGPGRFPKDMGFQYFTCCR